MSRFFISSAGIFVFFLLANMCTSNSTDTGLPGTYVIEKDKRFLIVDETGKEWEGTHAVKKYGMAPQGFQFGLGPFAIRPVLNPQLLSPGAENYALDNDEFLVLGAEISGDARAYSIDKLSDVEIGDDQFGEIHVAVAD